MFSSLESFCANGSVVRSFWVRHDLFVCVELCPPACACIAASYRAFCSGVNLATTSAGKPRPPVTLIVEVLCHNPVFTFIGVIFMVAAFNGGGAWSGFFFCV